MAPGLYGADIEQLRSLSKQMGQAGTRLKSVESTVNSLLGSVAWKGSDAEAFRNEWSAKLRPKLHQSGLSLQDQSKKLLVHADQQEKASNSATGSTGAPTPTGTEKPGDGRSWGDAFTDPDYEHAPPGIEWLLEKLGVTDGGQTSDVAQALLWAADKFGWNLELAKVEAGVSKFFDFMKGGSKVLGVLGGAIGVLDILSGIENKDPFRIADGVIGGGLSIAAIVATGTILGAPAGVVLGGAALVWGLLGMVSGDVPVTKRIWDFGAGVVGGIRDAGSWAGDRLEEAGGWVGRKVGLG